MPHSSRVALVTGCGKPVGIGNSSARALAAKGIAVVVSDVRPAGVANASMIAYLATGEAAFITGQAIGIDGGW